MPSRPDPRALALLACLSLASCTEDPVPSDSDTDDATGSTGTGDLTGTTADSTGADYPSLDERPCPEDSILTAENFGAPFMLTHCTGCHHVALKEGERAGAPLGVDFESLIKVRAQAERIWARAADQNATMPPVGPPAAEERARLGEWLACGAPTAADL
ncbi:hypothetical protein SAMN02745121_06781 [Nannocystis exedens]|uniref:Cytochrome c domain-containing protein n=1 Tax=Nannocystis exedens TaxID=54 RepID=A0A1I2FRP3_9BACT|nr:hypothetical protein [Nannocystis exedens]PCC74523.1 hypothetical protein NAEX_07619 [Nannocystis exedens]SFF07121.1 hypothetical protein SAMN02745121_06781 [Nannocystis exedens]